jgi:hypothetical protein
MNTPPQRHLNLYILTILKKIYIYRSIYLSIYTLKRACLDRPQFNLYGEVIFFLPPVRKWGAMGVGLIFGRPEGPPWEKWGDLCCGGAACGDGWGRCWAVAGGLSIFGVGENGTFHYGVAPACATAFLRPRYWARYVAHYVEKWACPVVDFGWRARHKGGGGEILKRLRDHWATYQVRREHKNVAFSVLEVENTSVEMSPMACAQAAQLLEYIRRIKALRWRSGEVNRRNGK